jgi:hypothetical protein
MCFKHVVAQGDELRAVVVISGNESSYVGLNWETTTMAELSVLEGVEEIALNVPQQGVALRGDPKTIAKFLDNEIAWYRRLEPIMRQQGMYQGNAIQLPNMVTQAVNFLQTVVKEVKEGKNSSLKTYENEARSYQVVIGQGTIGQRIDELQRLNRGQEVFWAMVVYCTKWAGGQDNVLATLRGPALANPGLLGAGFVNAVERAQVTAQSVADAMTEKEKELDAYVDRKNKQFGELEELFRQKLPVEEPAAFWQRKALVKNALAMGWLTVFAILAVAPVVIAVKNWAVLGPAFRDLTGNGSSFSLTSLAVVTIPALLYGWLLKNVSRLFIQHMNLADDAGHRRALAITWLGMVAEEKFQLSKEERALVLNAMFRPIPPHSQEDGPPSGLLELIKKQPGH